MTGRTSHDQSLAGNYIKMMLSYKDKTWSSKTETRHS